MRWHSAVRPEPLLLVTVAFHTSQLKIPRIHRFKQISSHRADRDQYEPELTKGKAISTANSNGTDQTAQINYYAHMLF